MKASGSQGGGPVVIVGAGAAGVTLAARLAGAGLDRSPGVTLLEAAASFPRDRTWSAFAVDEEVEPVTHAWDRWRVIDAGGRVVERCAAGRDGRPWTYGCVTGDAFFDAMRPRLGECRVAFDRPVTGVADGPEGGAVVALADGSTHHASFVFDSRPPDPFTSPLSRRETQFVQQFVGWRVRTQTDVFDPTAVVLMDFSVNIPAGDGFGFLYVLPFSKRDALVEATAVAGERLGLDSLAQAIEGYSSRQGAGSYDVTYREQGAIPMTTRPVVPAGMRFVRRIGLAGGAARPSTGYALSTIRRQADVVAAHLAGGGRLTALPDPLWRRPWRTTFLDRVLLAYLRRRPQAAQTLFPELFDRASPAALVRFLSERGGALDDVAIIAAMPKPPFIIEAVRSWRTWARR